MNSRKTYIFHITQVLFILFCTVPFISGCETVDKMIFSTPTDPTPTSSPADPTPTPTFQPSAPENTDDEQLDRLVRTKECIPPNQAEYVFGNYKLGWTMSGDRHEGLLLMKGRVGKMRIQYFNESINQTETVDQTMVLASCTKGLTMFGFNPVLADTGQEHPVYAADNLIFRRETNGDTTIINYDDQGVVVPVEIEQSSN